MCFIFILLFFTVFFFGKYVCIMYIMICLYHVYHVIFAHPGRLDLPCYCRETPQNAHIGIKNLLGEMGHEFPCRTFRPENRTTFSDIPLFSEIFLLNDSKNHVLSLSSFLPEFPQAFCKQ